jgi:hypothetical protein
MESIYLDTALLAVPNYAVDAVTANEIIDRVNYFAQLVLPGVPLRLVIADDLEAVLWGGNFGPDYDQLVAFLQLMEIDHVFTAHDLIRQYQTIMAYAIRPGNKIPIDVLTYSSFKTVPALPSGLFPISLRPETERIFVSVAALQTFENAWNVGSAIQGIGGVSFLTEATVDSASGTRVEELGSLPFQISTSVRVVKHLRDFVANGSAERLWANASTAEELHFAITLGGLSLLTTGGRGSEAGDLRNFSIGPEFRESLELCQCLRQGRFASATLTLCSQIVAGVCSRPIGVFGRPIQQVREFDSAGGYRVHLTSAALGLRLMFRGGRDDIEFSNVGVKGALQIAIGYRGGAVSSNVNQFL